MALKVYLIFKPQEVSPAASNANPAIAYVKADRMAEKTGSSIKTKKHRKFRRKVEAWAILVLVSQSTNVTVLWQIES